MPRFRVDKLRAKVGAFRLEGVSFDVPDQNPPLAIIGPNGAGKTTLFDTLTGVVPLISGAISLNEINIGRWTPARRARAGLRRTFQDARVFGDLTVRRNVELAMLAPTGGVTPRWLASIDRQVASGGVDVEGHLHRFHLHTVADSLANQTSFGQRKLLCLALSCAKPQSVLLLDEPVAGLHADMVDAVAEIVGGLTTPRVLIEHNFDFLRQIGCNAVLMDRGRLVGRGDVDEVMRSDAARLAYS